MDIKCIEEYIIPNCFLCCLKLLQHFLCHRECNNLFQQLPEFFLLHRQAWNVVIQLVAQSHPPSHLLLGGWEWELCHSLHFLGIRVQGITVNDVASKADPAPHLHLVSRKCHFRLPAPLEQCLEPLCQLGVVTAPMSMSSMSLNTPCSPSIILPLACNHVLLDRRFPITVLRKKYLLEWSMKVVVGKSSLHLAVLPQLLPDLLTRGEDLGLIVNQLRIQAQQDSPRSFPLLLYFHLLIPLVSSYAVYWTLTCFASSLHLSSSVF